MRKKSFQIVTLRLLAIFTLSLLLFSCSGKIDNPGQQEPTEQEPFDRSTIKKDFVDYFSGNLPIILSVPHGGEQDKSSYPKRTPENSDPSSDVLTGVDSYTIPLAEMIEEEIFKLTGKYPYRVMLQLRRLYVDANRSRVEAVPINGPQVNVYDLYHSRITLAREAIKSKWGRGLLIDVHAHGHSVQQVELGYNVTIANLNKDDAFLQSSTTAASGSSIYGLVQNNKQRKNFVQLLRGESSFGAALIQYGVACIPNPNKLGPGDEQYFNGGYITRTYGSSSTNGGFFDSVQMEFARDQRVVANRRNTAEGVAKAIVKFLDDNYPFSAPLY